MAAVAARAVAERLRIRIGLDRGRGYWNGDPDCLFAIGYDVFLECGRYVDCLLTVDLHVNVGEYLTMPEKVVNIFGIGHRLSLTEACRSVSMPCVVERTIQ